ncbi:MAG: CYTH domain-containing protein [Flavobacteriales bacterium]|nr:MAG: CYTH domain-containing protein [Flavobacteriales bacterium]
MIEIERKFLIVSDKYKEQAYKKIHILQGFLNTHKERTVRVRIKGEEAYITIKGISNKEGSSRFEWEKKIAVEEAEQLIELCEPNLIEKIRYEIKVGNHIFEVDEFSGENEGLIIAEIELSEENESFDKPDWLGKEVTGDIRYYNSQLSRVPYKNWSI